ncbi:zinc finger CCCH domain-containing protein 46 isoform X1 [Carex littledalei]|uniref:Zinc finger CCCH domain-containing protein 46 isoform X1 n=1 Tax=Carex littledalei TaxID=544730 RepID=A0A833QI81_9POAL|nr:zinc finger CCCH domain-containing protein 46 isoform X1 [Carex littledalei]
MSRRQEPCRHFLRGSCKFGANCRYLHVSPNQDQNQNQTRPSNNPFGFGASQFSQQQQQQKPNPFGFGVQNKNSTTQFQASSKPFENKWTRPTSTASKQTDSQTQASVHTCTDPESCKNIIADDFKNEAPLWKLTCYAHYKHLPCDIHGDISSEELRALAYEEAKQGRDLHSIIERERNLLQSKLSEFDNLLRKPYLPPNSNLGPTSQSNARPAFTSFSQLGAATNVTSVFRPPAPSSGSNNLFGQPSFLQNDSQMSTQPEMKFGTSVGTFGNQLTNQNQAFGSVQARAPNFSFGKSSNTNANGNTSGTQLFTSSFPHSSIGNSNASNKQQQQLSSLGFGFTSASPPSEEKQEDCKDDGIWLKEKWSIGEIPEEAPPLRYCR